MLDDYTLNVSFLGAFLVLVPFLFVGWHFCLSIDPAVRALPFLFMLYLNNVTRFQLDAIPTVGFSDPILSYWTAFLFYLDCVPMLEEGYEKVICLTPCVPSSYRIDDIPTFRQDQICSKLPIFDDGWCLQPDLISLMISRKPQMMSYLGRNY